MCDQTLNVVTNSIKKAKILGKEKYPYAEVTPLAIKLWKHFRPDVKIYIKIIYTK